VIREPSPVYTESFVTM